MYTCAHMQGWNSGLKVGRLVSRDFEQNLDSSYNNFLVQKAKKKRDMTLKFYQEEEFFSRILILSTKKKKEKRH